MQVRERIEDQIINDELKEGEKAPSTSQLVNFYKINHLTVAKGVNQLVEEGILYRKRGIGTFVAEGAREILLQKRKESFFEEHVMDLVFEARKLGITEDEIVAFIKETEEEEKQ
jgi:DNA-binding transcriptional regulator YhcF (GntR family)